MNKRLKMGIFFIIGILLMASFVAAYYRSYSNYAQYGYSNTGSFQTFDRTQCEAGQDFILQIDPLGCEPAIVRSDLLEDQNVPVFCPISATNLNPLVDVETVDYITFTGQYPKEVATVGFHPAKSALGTQAKLNSPVLNNIGYAVIVLRKQGNESAMPEYVEGNLTAKIIYDVENAFGVGKSIFYLPVLTEAEWEQKYLQYGFWDGRAYLRAEGVGDNQAIISIYSDQYRKGILGQGDEKQLYSTVTLEEGEVSRELYIPGFDSCMATMNLKLNDLESPDTRARFRIDGGEYVEIADNEKFLENKCTVTRIDKQGINQEVYLRCREDKKISNPKLKITPEIVLNIDGEDRTVAVGDFLYYNKNNQRKVFLGYVGTTGETDNLEDLYTYLVAIPKEEKASDKLTSQEIESAKKIAEAYEVQKKKGEQNVWQAAKEDFEHKVGMVRAVVEWVGDGEWFMGVHYGDSLNVFGTDVEIIDFAGAKDELFSDEIMENYENAIEDYREVVDSYPGEDDLEEEDVSLGESALYNMIELSFEMEQKKTMLGFCEEFKEKFPDSEKSLELCNDNVKIANSGVSTTDVLIDGQLRRISFEGVYEPSLDEYSATVRINYPSGDVKDFTLPNNGEIYLNPGQNNEYLKLIDLEEDSAKFEMNFKAGTSVGEAFNKNTEVVSLDVPETFNSAYTITLTNINLKKVAKVSVIPNIDYAKTEADFKFRINIDKRDIQLSPEKTQEKIDNLQKSIEEWSSISETLGNFVQNMKTACIATSAWMVVKNYVENVDGKGIARGEVMRGENGWYEKCANIVAQDPAVKTQEQCLIENADEIDEEVETMHKFISEQDEEIEKLQSKYEMGGEKIFGNKKIDTTSYVTDYSEKVTGTFDSDLASVLVNGNLEDPTGKEESIDIGLMKEVLSGTGWEEHKYDVSQLRDIELYTNIIGSDEATSDLKEIAEQRLYSTLLSVQINSEADQTKISWLNDLNEQSKLNNVDVQVFGDVESVTGVYDKGTSGSTGFGSIPANVPVQGIIYSNKEYLLELENVDGTNYIITNIYNKEGVLVEDEAIVENIKKRINGFVKYDDSSYENEYKDAEVRYYETEPYAGYPAVVPFDIENGWYAAVKQTLPVLGESGSYDKSGRVASYYLCNVGKNGFEDNLGNDDVCELINEITEFPGITNQATVTTLIKTASNAINEAQTQHRNGIKTITITSPSGVRQRIKVGNPAVDIPDIQCQDFMSPKDCNTLFNVCDPVICPSSRCNFGGNYYVKDVIQSGIIGSIALCLPNYREKIYIPVCLTGIKAGIDGLLSIFTAYEDCLQESLDTGSTVGICDEIHSVYLCEYFYSQAVPLARLGIPLLTETLMGKRNTQGGGEYLGVADAWSRAESSVTYLTQYYGQNSYEAFKARSVEDAGQEVVCDTFISLSYPGGSDLLDAITTPDSPVQFYGRFEETSFTTATNPPISHYKVYYHIYAGEDTGAYYKVYLKGDTGSSLYQDTDVDVSVATGYVGVGDYASETKDFTAPSGYDQLCISVNGQEECGFKQVTTSFAVNYIEEQYLAEQVTQTDIETESECVSGSISAYSLLNLNLQSAIEDLVDPSIEDLGITRICATNNPGSGTNPDRWAEVGSCGEGNLKCWLDQESVKEVIDFVNVEEEALETTTNNYLDILRSEGNYLSEEEFESSKEELEDLESNGEKITFITGLLERAFLNSEKGNLLFWRGNVYSEIVKIAYEEIKDDDTESQDEEDSSEESSSDDETEETSEESSNVLEEILNNEWDWENWEDVKGDFMEEFDSTERELIINAKDCGECGDDENWYTLGLENICNEAECLAIGFRLRDELGLNKMCAYSLLSGCDEVIIDSNSNLDISGGETCEVVEPLKEIKSEDAQKKVLEAATILEGRIVERNLHCYDAADSVYEKAGVEISNCMYSDNLGKDYSGAGIEIDGSIFQVATYSEKCFFNNGLEDLDEEDKLKNLQPGYMISYAAGTTAPHNAIFVEWIDEDTSKARLFDWNGRVLTEGQTDSLENTCTEEDFYSGEEYCKTFRYYNTDISDDQHPVYMYWAPASSGPVVASTETEEVDFFLIDDSYGGIDFGRHVTDIEKSENSFVYLAESASSAKVLFNTTNLVHFSGAISDSGRYDPIIGYHIEDFIGEVEDLLESNPTFSDYKLNLYVYMADNMIDISVLEELFESDSLFNGKKELWTFEDQEDIVELFSSLNGDYDIKYIPE